MHSRRGRAAQLLADLRRRGPDGQHKGDLVDEIGKIVNQIEVDLGDGAHQIAEEVAQGIDGPANGNNEPQRKKIYQSKFLIHARFISQIH